jgi:hypothetical protein
MRCKILLESSEVIVQRVSIKLYGHALLNPSPLHQFLNFSPCYTWNRWIEHVIQYLDHINCLILNFNHPVL